MRNQNDLGSEPLGLRALKQYARAFPVEKGKERIIRFLWKPLARGRHDHTSQLAESSLKVRCDITQFIQRHLYFRGGYEVEYCKHWKRLAQQAEIIFDVGANVGLYSLLAAEANPQAQIHAFEPTREILTILQSNIELNGIENITVNAVGVGSHAGKAILRQDKGSDGANEGTNFVVDTETMSQTSDRFVSLMPLDDYCEQQGLDRIDLIKMDIEGGEYQALMGAQRLLRAQRIGCLFIEFAEWAAQRSGSSLSQLRTLLEENGYSLNRLTSRGLASFNHLPTGDGENIVALRDGFPKF
jgi:FkbM family methyltransferase